MVSTSKEHVRTKRQVSPSEIRVAAKLATNKFQQFYIDLTYEQTITYSI